MGFSIYCESTVIFYLKINSSVELLALRSSSEIWAIIGSSPSHQSPLADKPPQVKLLSSLCISPQELATPTSTASTFTTKPIYFGIYSFLQQSCLNVNLAQDMEIWPSLISGLSYLQYRRQ